MNSPPKVSIIIVNFNGLADTIECLESVVKINYPNFNVCVVDNGSKLDELSMILSRFPSVRSIQNESNLGYAGAINVAIKEILTIGSDYIIVLNNDTVVDYNFIWPLIKIATSFYKVAVVGCKILYYSFPNIIWTTGGRFYSGIGYRQDFGMNKTDGRMYSKIESRDWVSGCAMLIDCRILFDIQYGGDYPTEADDIEFCYKVRRLGYFVAYCPESFVWHKVSKTKMVRKGERRIDSTLQFALSNSSNRLLTMLSYMLVSRNIPFINYLLFTPNGSLKKYYRRKMISEIKNIIPTNIID